MYDELAKLLRKCKGTNRDGSPCRAWALWSSSDQMCRRHTHDEGAKAKRFVTRANVCRCAAYTWPHRPASGLCRWPSQPTQAHPTPVSTHKAGPRRSYVIVERFTYDARRDPIEKLIAWMNHQNSEQAVNAHHV